jgi:hypothetical protein
LWYQYLGKGLGNALPYLVFLGVASASLPPGFAGFRLSAPLLAGFYFYML